MRKFIYMLVFIFFSCETSGVLFDDALCIQNITTIDAENGLKENQTVIIKEGKIEQIIPSQEIKLSDENTIVDGRGKFMVPGLWDTHIHFSYIEELAPSMLDLFLVYGITSVRDTGGDINFVNKWKRKSLDNPTAMPRVMVAGPLLDGMPNVYDGSSPGRPPLSVGLQSVAEVKEEVRELINVYNVDFLKAYEMLMPEQFVAITQLAKENGLKVTGHVPLSMDVISASNAGLNSMEHMRNLELSCASNADELLRERRKLLASGKSEQGGDLRSRIHQQQRETAVKNFDADKAKEVLRILKKNETWQIPTVTLSTGFTKRHFATTSWQESFKYIPKNIEQEWKENIEVVMQNDVSEFNTQYTDWIMSMIGEIHDSGIEIMAGTDCPIFFLTPGLSLHQEMANLVDAGLSPIEVLKTATLNPARYFNLENELGTIEKGKWADLVILDANPLENINNTKQINAVLKQGNYFDRNDLDQILEKLDNN